MAQYTDSTYTKHYVTGDESEDELIKKLDIWFKDSEKLQKKRREWIEKNRKYYEGDQIENKLDRPTYRSRTVHNKIFENVETIVPILTENPAQPLGSTPSQDPDALKAVRTVESALKYLYRKDGIQLKSEMIIRNMILDRDAIVTPGWDKNIGVDGDVTIEVVDSKYFYVDPNSTYEDKGDYFFKVVPRTYRYLVKNFPDKVDEIRECLGYNSTDEQKKREDIIDVKECWYWKEEGKEFNVWRTIYVKNKILADDKNPYWDFVGIADPEMEMVMHQEIATAQENYMLKMGAEMPEEEIKAIVVKHRQHRRTRNFLPKQELPYIIFPTFLNNQEPYSTTSLIEQVIPLIDSLNKRKQQIDENANLMTNGQWIIDKNAGVNVKLLNNAPGTVVQKNPGTEARRESGVAMPGYVFEDKSDTERAIDMIFGANSISKGQVTNAKTAAEATLLKEADRGRVALLGRHYEIMMEKVYQWQVHIMKLMYEEERQVALFNACGEIEAYDTISRDMIPDDMQIYVQIGSAKPIDQTAKRAEAMQQFQGKMIDPITYFEQLGDYSNPKEKAEMLWKWNSGTLFEQPQPPQIQAQAEEQAYQENQQILLGKTVQPMQKPTQAHVEVHMQLLDDKTIALTQKQIMALKELIDVEQDAVTAMKVEKEGQPAAMPADIAAIDPEALTPEQAQQAQEHAMMLEQGQQETMQEQMPEMQQGIEEMVPEEIKYQTQ